MFDIEKYIEQRWSKFYETLDKLQSVVDELERLRSQTLTECLPPQDEVCGKQEGTDAQFAARSSRSDDQVLPQGFDKRICEGCGGDGKWRENGIPENCEWCNGHGYYWREKAIEN